MNRETNHTVVICDTQFLVLCVLDISMMIYFNMLIIPSERWALECPAMWINPYVDWGSRVHVDTAYTHTHTRSDLAVRPGFDEVSFLGYDFFGTMKRYDERCCSGVTGWDRVMWDLVICRWWQKLADFSEPKCWIMHCYTLLGLLPCKYLCVHIWYNQRSVVSRSFFMR